jgi:hypothetical protein
MDGQSRFYVNGGIVPTKHRTIGVLIVEALTLLLVETSLICEEVYGAGTGHTVA